MYSVVVVIIYAIAIGHFFSKRIYFHDLSNSDHGFGSICQINNSIHLLTEWEFSVGI